MKKIVIIFENISKIITPIIALIGLGISIFSLNYSINLNNKNKEENLFININVLNTLSGKNLIMYGIFNEKELKANYPRNFISGGSIIIQWDLLLVNNDFRPITITDWAFYQYLIDKNGKRTHYCAYKLFYKNPADAGTSNEMNLPIILKPNEHISLMVESYTVFPELIFKLYKELNIMDLSDDYRKYLSLFELEINMNHNAKKDLFGVDLKDIKSKKLKNEYIPYSTFILEIKTDRKFYEIPLYLHSKIMENEIMKSLPEDFNN